MFPPVLKFLLISNIGIFVLQLLCTGLTFNGTPIDAYIDYYGALHPIGDPAFRVWQFVTYMFLHEGLMHVGFNMLVLWMFGVEVENFWGSKKFLIFYFLCGFGGAAAHLLVSPLLGQSASLIGASGAIFGVMVAFGLLYPDRMIYIYFLLPIRAKYLIPILLGIEVFMGIRGGDNIGHLAHLGGALVGIIYMIADAGGPALLGRLRSSSGNRSPGGFWRQNPSQSPPPQPMFRRSPFREQEPVEAEYQDLGRASHGAADPTPTRDKQGARVITQDVIDRILDKIAATGYQNLTQEEREILFEASRKMEGKS